MEWYHVVATIAGNLAIILPLWLWNRTESRADLRQMDSKIEAWKTETISLIQAIKDEMKDFHGRLERQDAEFKGRLERQDAEFKAHIMHCHKN